MDLPATREHQEHRSADYPQRKSRIHYFASVTHCATQDLSTSMQKVSPLFILMMVCSAL
jgi:hypothetical protein